MIRRFKILLTWVLFIPFVLTIGVLFIPLWLFTEIDTFLWLHNYIEYMVGESSKLELNKPVYYNNY